MLILDCNYGNEEICGVCCYNLCFENYKDIHIFHLKLPCLINSVKVSSPPGFKFILMIKTLHEKDMPSSSKPSLNHFLRG